MEPLDITKPVKFIEPINEDEAKLIFKVVNFNDVTNRAYIETINLVGMSILPQQLVDISWITNI